MAGFDLNGLLRKSLGGVLGAFSRPKKRLQVAALCYRTKGTVKEVLLITSRDTGRWILPKGWPIKGKSGSGSALQEAWEEAGVKSGNVGDDPVGHFDYQKRLDDGAETTCHTNVFPIEVTALSRSYPEHKQRKRKWVSFKAAAKMVQEPELQTILRKF